MHTLPRQIFSILKVLIAILGTVGLVTLIVVIEANFGAELNCGPHEYWLVCQVRESVFLEFLESFSILSAVILFFLETPDRKKQAHYEAWRTNLSGATLENARLSHADLIGCDLTRADLTLADLKNADLRQTNLTAAQLKAADLRGADLAGANLRQADLSGANLNNANLAQTNLKDADFAQVKNLRPKQVTSAIEWQNAKYDEEFRASLGLLPS